MITVPCPMCGETLEGAVRLTQVSPLKGASIIECPGCDYRLEFRYAVAKKGDHSDGLEGDRGD